MCLKVKLSEHKCDRREYLEVITRLSWLDFSIKFQKNNILHRQLVSDQIERKEENSDNNYAGKSLII